VPTILRAFGLTDPAAGGNGKHGKNGDHDA
jgi:hypothetical protein